MIERTLIVRKETRFYIGVWEVGVAWGIEKGCPDGYTLSGHYKRGKARYKVIVANEIADAFDSNYGGLRLVRDHQEYLQGLVSNEAKK